ncbi:TPA: hypothetical protein ACGCGV_000164 [Stenotrophomonas maltophilia]|uniref:dihydrodipicolinate synthase family protein n=1 Tax=Stenotrophomonas maltophilia TaxID=40324 RepID=UPI000AAEA9FD|nr:dihydrodipicolinate synthase family protein [Stenotrophomonas maltophilia]MDZ5777594.1 hypothetical protein [Stenotrophomonas maltophilia]HEL3212239.1 hypothetical protein [Stenotrophomonas maltophilia]
MGTIDSKTRWQDKKGRTWRVIQNLNFGRYLCVLEDRPALSGYWTSKDIRAAMAGG